jgi:outer membrane receptor protein involved in Fe transport
MHSLPASGRSTLLATVLVGLAIWITPSQAHSASGHQGTNEIRIVGLQGTVEIAPAGTTRWFLTQTNQILVPTDKLRTGPNSRVALRWSDQSVASFGALTVLEILPAHEPGAANGLNLIGGLLSFFHRDPPGRIRVITRGGAAGVKGTEFVVAVETIDGTERTTFSVIDGTVQFGNDQDSLTLTNSQQAVAELGKAPVRTAGFTANNVLQWCFYYPAVLDLRDLPLSAEEEQLLGRSLAAYRTGDLPGALARYPNAREPVSDAERVYYAALLLSVGQVEKTEAIMKSLPGGDRAERLQRLATALRELIAAVKRENNPSTLSPQLSTELLAASYYEQSRAVREDSLQTALTLARQAATNSPQFGFAWARVAELEFSFGRNGRALEALNKSLELSPGNAQALALKGFILAGQNKTREAIDWFNRSMAVDAALGNAWLGRGLCRIRRGDANGGREDLLVAAALEPQRSLLRSYLAKGYGDADGTERARHEFDLAKHLDDADPTPWLYSALLSRQENQINAAVNELEQSIQLNANRSLFRSELLLDQDRAVRSASLASIYREAGMPEVSLREAASAVSYDYANYSAHLFLANSFDALRDPTRFNLRYETAWFNELLLANLLAPAGAGAISPNISQQEYFRLFERDRFGLASTTEVRSDRQYREVVSQFGSSGGFGYSLDLDYQHNDGVRPNNELDRIEWYSTIKHQITSQDSLLLLTKYQDYHSGDNFQYYNPANARPDFKFDESQSPIVLGGYHHEWQPGVHTLVLAGRLENDQRFSDRGAQEALLFRDTQISPSAPVVLADSVGLDVAHRSTLEIYTVEIQQIFDTERHSLLLGSRWQAGEIDTRDLLANPADFTNDFAMPAADIAVEADFNRFAAYAYETLKLPGHVRLSGGLTYDWLRYPRNFRSPPISAGEETRSRLNPKAAVVWDILPQATLRAAYARSLGGVSLDESYRLEPTQLAGFSQAFRTLISESLAGSVSAPDHEVAGMALDLKFNTRTYIGLQGQFLNSRVHETIGVFDYFFASSAPQKIFPSSTRHHLDYDERSASMTMNQLLSDEWSIGAQYSFVRSELESSFPELDQLSPPPDSLFRADLHCVTIGLLYNRRSGFFAQAGWEWYFQNRSRAAANPPIVADVPDETLSQLNLFCGYRFPRQRGDFTIGLLNVTDQDYHLNPVTPYAELPRERVFYARLRFRF